jgi:hypothetical protein
MSVSPGAATRALAKSLRALSKVPSRISRPFAEWATKTLRANIRKGVTPYGAAFAPLLPQTVRRKKGNSKPLIRSRALVGNVRAVPLARGGVGLDGGGGYPGHITGEPSGRMAARPYLPVNTLPVQWRAEIKRLTDEAFSGLGK